MANLTQSGENDIRSYIESNWNYLSIVDDSGNEITRVDVSSDSRFTMSSSGSVVTFSGSLAGGDSDVSLPTTAAGAEVYKSSSASTVLGSESFPNANLQTSQDNIDIDTTISVN